MKASAREPAKTPAPRPAAEREVRARSTRAAVPAAFQRGTERGRDRADAIHASPAMVAQRRRLPGGGRPVAQRFPANVHAAPYDWAGGNVQVAPLGGGQMAAIFRLRDNGPVAPGEHATVIVKALEVDEPESVHLGEEFLRQMGMATPADRIIPTASAEFGPLADRLGLAAHADGYRMVGTNPVGGLLLMEDLGAAGAETIQSKLMAATTQADIDEVFAWVTDTTVLDTVGRLIVYDAAVGNFDRITLDAQNFGNLMIRKAPGVATQVFLIDTNARLPQLEHKILGDARIRGAFYEERVMNSKLLTNLFAHRDWAIGNWIEAIPRMVHDQQGLREDAGGAGARNAFLDAQQAYIAQKVQAAMAASRARLTAATDQAFVDLRAMMANKADPRRAAIKAAARGTQSFDTLKAQVGYLEQRSRPAAALPGGPLGHETAASIVEIYGRYKVAKATAGLPANLAADPVAYVGLVVPRSVRAGRLKETLSTERFKQAQARDFATFHADYLTFKADLEHHCRYLEQLASIMDNVVQLRRSLAGPGETRNQRAMVTLQKRQAEAQRLQALLRPALPAAVSYAASYRIKAVELRHGAADAGERHAAFRNQAGVLDGLVDRLAAAVDRVADLRAHI